MEYPRKARRIQKTESGRLSHLIPDLRTHIVSFLPTKEAFKLGVLSTQWKYTCRSLPQLEFNLFEPEPNQESYDKHKQDFKNCLNKILTCHTTRIQRFALTVDVDDKLISNSDLNDWITVVLQHHHVVNLFLSVRSNKPITYYRSSVPVTLPSSLFASSTLRELKLYGVQLSETSSIRFPMVTKLALRGVTFCGEDDDLGNKLFSTTIFPVLQSLEIVCCDQIHSLSISIPCFIHLCLATCLQRPTFQLSIPTLQQFDYKVLHRYFSGIEFSAHTISSLRAMTLDTRLFKTEYPPKSANASAILPSMYKVETLNISDYFVECLSWDESFANINRSFSFSLTRFCLEMYRTKRHVQVIKFLTGCFPLLQTLVINFTDVREFMVSHQENELQLVNAGAIMLCHLRVVKIRGFCASDSEVELVSCLFLSSRNLEEMIVSCEKEISPHDRMAIDVKLKSLPKVSQNLKLVCR